MLHSPQILVPTRSIIAAGGAFTPASLSNLIAWYKADVGVTLSGANITAVADQSGIGNNLANSGTDPFNATSAYNSKPAFDFTVANDAGLATGTGATGTIVLPVVNRFTAWCIGRMNSGTASFGGVMSIAQGTPTNDWSDAVNIAMFGRNATSAVLETSYSTVAMDTSMSTGTNHRWVATYDGANIQHYVDGVAGTSAAFSVSLTTPTNILIGNRWLGSTFSGGAWDGPICETGIAMSFANSTVVAQLDNYLTGKWGS